MADELEQTVKTVLEEDHARLAEYLSIETVSAQNRGIQETVDFLKREFTKLGADNVETWQDVGDSNPFVFAEFKAGENGNANKTLLFYNHYDVQPPEPLDEWTSKPFELTEKDGQYVARGVSDDKGELMVRLSSVKVLQQTGGLPCNLKFIVEGGEEVGSPFVPEMVAKHADQLKADALVWETGGKDADDNFQVTCGLKGIMSFELTVQTAESDLHSSLAAYADNAAWRLTKALASLKDDNNRVLVDGFYDDVRELTPTEKAAVEQLEFNAATTRETFGLKRPFVTDDPKTALINDPTMTINGLTSGYEGDGVKTVLPKFAKAKLDCRLVPNQDPKKIADLIQKQLDKNGYEDVHVTFLLGEDPFRSNLDDPFVQLAVDTAHEVYGNKVKLVPNAAGGGPEAPFSETLNVPVVAVGSTFAGSGPHAPNESVRVADYAQDVSYTARLLNHFKDL